ncbi:MAG: hypothetical protein OXI79_13810 [Gammaproteobacteria bacterium]|nr:hypothetical protein [Gammaproteobacteria bacterium]
MEATENLAGTRIRERSEKRVRAPWTYRCRGSNLAIDVDAFDVREASSLSAAHWDVEPDKVAVDGQRRRWLRWIGISTHEASGRDNATERDWWYATRLLAVIVAAYVVHMST